MGDEQTDTEVRLVDPLSGRLVDGRYRVRELIASGGMARVYLADDERLERRVALKIINDAHATNPLFADAFAHEAKTIARLSHPHVVAVFDQGRHEGLPYVVMEYVPGDTLRDLLNRRGRLGVAEALSLIDQVLDGLAAAHQIGLVHRDVKPENILITSRDGRTCVKVADFGLAHAVQTGGDASDTGPILATVAYVSPELLTGGSATARCDVYATGILLFEMLTGSVPFDDPDPMAVALMHVERDVPHPSAIRAEVPDAVDALVKRCTRRRPADRPADALSVGRMLRSVNADSPRATGQARPAARVTRQRRSWNMPRPRLGMVVQLVVSLLVLAAISTGGWWLADGRYTQAPSLLDQKAADVARIAAGHGMSITFAPARFSESVPKSKILEQDPAPGERIRIDGVITVTVSKGPERYEVPELIGVALAQAQRELTDLTLVSEVTGRHWHDRFAVGEVISADPPTGERVHRGTVVELVVSDGPPPARVPDLVGREKSTAERLVKEEGLALKVTSEYSDSVPAGEVISQSPKPGTGTNKGTKVTILVSQGPAPVEIPDVVGLPVDQATKKLADAGFDAEVRMDLADGDGDVFKQSPGAGETRPRGSRVALYAQLLGGLFDE